MSSTTIKAADMFLVRALEKIVGDKEVKKAQNSQLKKACEVALEEIKKDLKTQPNAGNLGINYQNAEKYFLPFELACKMKSAKIVETSLDCIQKLIAHGYLNDHVEAQIKQLLINRLTRIICECFEGPHVDDQVQLQIIKCLLTILTSPYVEVHDYYMLLPIKTCYNIHISSKSLVNQASARAALTQIINTILQRYDASIATMSKSDENKKSSSDLQNNNNDTISINSESTINDASSQQYDKYVQIVHDTLISVDSEVDSELFDEIADVMLDLVDSVCKDSVAKSSRHHQRKASITQNGDDIDLIVPPQPLQQQQQQTAASKDPELAQIRDPYERDAFLMFRAFCRLSQRPILDGTQVDIKNNIEIRSKILSLQLILTTLQNAKQAFKQNRHIISIIRKYLCVSLTKNGVSPITEVFEFSLAIFVSLLVDYKKYLKKQVEIFFREIIIYLLETQTSSFEHKWLIIQTLTRICADAQCVVDLYVNYDCDLQATNIFARLIEILAKLAQGRQSIELGCNAVQIKNLRLKALECLVSILKCMVEWSKDLYINPNEINSEISNAGSSSSASSNSSEITSLQSYNSNVAAPPAVLSSNSGSLSSISTSTTTVADDFELLKQRKEVWEHGIELFNKKPKNGIKYLQQHNLLGTKVDEISEFLYNEERLDKTVIGDFIGDNDAFNKEVMYSYVDRINFYNMEIVSALRFFLERFRIPGEAQKIDRLMEKFAHRYHECNKKLALNTDSEAPKQPQQQNLINYYFESADAVYVSAFSIIMLATDLHSSSVKRKMNKDDYVKMNRGINENKDLPREFLEQIYDLVAESELKLKDTGHHGHHHHKSHHRNEAVVNETRRRLLYNMEIEQVMKTARSLMESMSHITTEFTSATYGQHIKPMFKIVWTPFLAAFSIHLQDTIDDQRVIELCINGIRFALRLACIFHLELERDAYIQALARFTLLQTTSPIIEIKAKNVECIKSLIQIAHSDGNYLGSSWLEILKCISQLELAQLLGNHTGRKSITIALTPSTVMHAASTGLSSAFANSSHVNMLANTSFDNIDKTLLANIQQQISETVSQNIVVAVDRIFTGSVRLDGDAVNEFVRALCAVSVDELSATPPRMYSLQKIVEISYYNMSRIRLQWTRLWHIIGEHFNKAGCNGNEEVAFFSVDSLRQLAMKFLEKGEFANFRFQKDFLKPFEHIMKKNNSYTIKDMVVQCISQMCKSQAHNIKSGWKNIFSVFHLAASTNDDRIVSLSFETVTDIVKNIADKYLLSILDSFQDAIKCLSEFACNSSSPDISIDAIGLIRHCACFVAEKPNVFAEYSSDDLKNVPEEDRVWVKGWFPILFELSCIINRCKLDVRTRGLTVMFEIMKTYGESFNSRWWKDLFNIVFRIFDNMKLPEAQIEKAEWMTTTCNHALYAIIDVFTQYFEIMSPILIEDLYSQLKWCIKQDNEQLARSGTNCLENFVISNGKKFNEAIWEKTCKYIAETFHFTVPHSLLTWKPEQQQTGNTGGIESAENLDDSFHLPSPSPSRHQFSQRNKRNSVSSLNSSYSEDNTQVKSKIPHSRVPEHMEHRIFHSLLIKCIVQLELIQTIDNIIFYPRTSIKEDANYFAAAQALSTPTSNVSIATLTEQLNDSEQHGMYQYLTNEQLFLLFDCLHESFEFACAFNQNSEQRNILWKAGFKGKDKPNLLKHETQSLACMLRILFKMLNDDSRESCLDETEARLIKLCNHSIQYYLMISSESHRESWDNILLLLLTKLLKLDSIKFKNFTSKLYRQLCDIMTFNLKLELRSVLRELFIQIGSHYSIAATAAATTAN